MQISSSGSQGKGMKQYTVGVRRSKVKFTRRRGCIGRPDGGIVLEPLSRVAFLVFVCDK